MTAVYQKNEGLSRAYVLFLCLRVDALEARKTT